MGTTQTTAQDLYPSRVEREPRFIKRVDPVVWGGPEDGPLSAEQLEQFRRDGCLIVEGVFTPDEVTRFNTRLDELSRDPEVRARQGTITEPESDEVRSVFDVHRGDPVFEEVAADRRVADVARQILASEVSIHQSRINFKPGFAGKEFWWHSDFETWHTEDGMPNMRALSASITLTDNYEVNGPLMVVAGSQNTFVSTVGETPDDNYKSSLKRQQDRRARRGEPRPPHQRRRDPDDDRQGRIGRLLRLQRDARLGGQHHARSREATSSSSTTASRTRCRSRSPQASRGPEFLANREVVPVGR
jgi:ectoine hydroxylase